MNLYSERGHLLLEQQRWNDALEQFGKCLLSCPEDADAHCGAAIALLQLEQLEKAESHARAAVAADPNDARAHYVLGHVLCQRQQPKEALAALEASLELDAGEPLVLGLRAHIFCDQVNWKQALESAQLGLELDPQCSMCLTARARALVGMGSADLAEDSLLGGLSQNVEDPLLHASMGWAALAAKDREKALLHFAEALRLDPELEWARQGMLAALCLRHRFYRLIFAYYMWMSRMTPRARWGVIVVGYFACRALSVFGRANPAWQGWVVPVVLVYAIFVYLTWTGQSLGKLLLRLDKNGRRLLDQEDFQEANWVGGLWAAALASFLIVPFITGSWLLGLTCLLLVIPVSATFACQKGRPRQLMGALTVVLAVAGLGGFFLGFVLRLPLGLALAKACLPLYFLSLIAANFLMAARPKR